MTNLATILLLCASVFFGLTNANLNCKGTLSIRTVGGASYTTNKSIGDKIPGDSGGGSHNICIVCLEYQYAFDCEDDTDDPDEIYKDKVKFQTLTGKQPFFLDKQNGCTSPFTKYFFPNFEGIKVELGTSQSTAVMQVNSDTMRDLSKSSGYSSHKTLYNYVVDFDFIILGMHRTSRLFVHPHLGAKVGGKINKEVSGCAVTPITHNNIAPQIDIYLQRARSDRLMV